MAWAKCRRIGCTMQIRVGLRRYGIGVNGQPLADGLFCWKCRARQAEPKKREKVKEAP